MEEGIWRCNQVAVAVALLSRRKKLGDEIGAKGGAVWTRRREHVADVRDQLLELFGHGTGGLERKPRSGKETSG